MSNPEKPFAPKDVMRYYIDKDPNAEYVALQHYGINDIGPMMPQLASLHHMKHLNMSYNNLSKLPDDMASLQLETLDISGNPFNEAEAVINGLQSLPNMLHLKVTLPENEIDKLITRLKNIHSINGVNIGHVPDLSPLSRGYEISNVDVKMDLHYRHWNPADTERFRQVYETVGKVGKNITSSGEYEEFSKTVIAHLHSKTKSETDVAKLQVHQINAAALLLEMAFDEFARISTNYGSDIGTAVQTLFEQHVLLMRKSSITMAYMQEDRDRKIAALQEDLKREIILRERMERASYKDTSNINRCSGYTNKKEIGEKPTKQPHEYMQKDNLSISNIHVSQNKGSIRRKDLAYDTVGSDEERFLSISEVRAFIKMLFKSKCEHDTANKLAQLPAETVEQHIYTLLCSQTQQEDVIKHRIATFYKSIDKYVQKEIDIEVFSLIIKNKLDEDYYHEHLKHEVSYYNAIQSVVGSASTEKRSPTSIDGYLDESQVRKIIETVLPPSAEKHRKLLRQINSQMRGKEFEPDDHIIMYNALSNIILRFFLNEHLDHIRPFVRAFETVDTMCAGVIGIDQFKRVLRLMFENISSFETQEISNTADPFNNDVVSFSIAFRTIEKYLVIERKRQE